MERGAAAASNVEFPTGLSMVQVDGRFPPAWISPVEDTNGRPWFDHRPAGFSVWT
jgi:hypothetical protein